MIYSVWFFHTGCAPIHLADSRRRNNQAHNRPTELDFKTLLTLLICLCLLNHSFERPYPVWLFSQAKNCIGKWCVPIQMSQCSCFQQRQLSSEVWRCKCVYVLLSMAKEASEGPRALLSRTGQEASHQPKHTDNCSPEHNHLLNTGLLRIAHSHRHRTEFMCAVCFKRDVSH